MQYLSRLLLPFFLLLFSGAPALAQSGEWTVTEVKGVVTIVDVRGERPAKAGATLAAGAALRTEARSSAVLVRGREFVTMRQKAQIRLPAARERGLMQILQDYGSALFNIGKQPNPHFGVETPYLAAVVKGTTFVISVTGEGASLQVTEGAVEASTQDGGVRELILPGSVAMIAAGDPMRMVIEGEGRRVMDSPARGAGAPAAAPMPGAAVSEPAAQNDRGPVRIEEAVYSTPRDLGEVSGGFVSGEVAVLAAGVAADYTARGNAPAVGDTAGRGNDGVVCAGGACANDNGAGNVPGDPPDRAPANGAPGNDNPGERAPGNGNPPAENGDPAVGAAGNGDPGDGTPGNRPPADGPPGNGNPGDRPPADAPPVDGTPGNRPPADGPPGNGNPGDRPPADAPPVDGTPGNRPPADGPPGNGNPGDRPPADAPPVDGTPGNRPPADGPPGNGGGPRVRDDAPLHTDLGPAASAAAYYHQP